MEFIPGFSVKLHYWAEKAKQPDQRDSKNFSSNQQSASFLQSLHAPTNSPTTKSQKDHKKQRKLNYFHDYFLKELFPWLRKTALKHLTK